jgi:predicted Holliday junction resolvase-like endonuclease
MTMVVYIFLLCIIGILLVAVYEKENQIKKMKEKVFIAEGKYNLLVNKLREKREQRGKKDTF